MSYTFKVTLTDIYGNPVYHRLVYLYVDNNLYNSDYTGSDGTVTFTVDLQPGTHTISAIFYGDELFIGSSASLTINVPQPTPTPTATPTPTVTPTPTPTASPSPSPTPTPTSIPSPTPTPTASPSPSPTPTYVPTPTPTPYPQPSPSAVCRPILTTGVSWLDSILFCVGGYGVTVFTALITFILLLLIL
jgi:hypothetical protein